MVERREDDDVRGNVYLATGVLAAIGMAVGVEAAAGSHASGGIGDAAAVAPAVRARLTAIARKVTKENDDARVHQATVVLTTRQMAAGGDIVNGNQPVYELVLRGLFVCSMCSWPPGGHAPRGEVITMTIDRATMQQTDFSVGGRPPVIGQDAGTFTLRW